MNFHGGYVRWNVFIFVYLILTGNKRNNGKCVLRKPFPLSNIKQGTLMFFEYCEKATINRTVLKDKSILLSQYTRSNASNIVTRIQSISF